MIIGPQFCTTGSTLDVITLIAVFCKSMDSGWKSIYNVLEKGLNFIVKWLACVEDPEFLCTRVRKTEKFSKF